MKIGLIIAIERELKSFLNNGSDIKSYTVSNRTVYETKIGNHEIYAMKSGYGIIDASSATQLLITKYSCELIVNFGVTGALQTGLKVEDLFVVRKACNYDYDVSPIDPVKEHQYEEFRDEFIPLDDGYIDFVKSIYPNIKEAVVASGGRFIEKKEDKISLNNLGCNICDMEIAGIARVCFLCGVKCLSIKCISDTFEGDGGDFNKNVIASAERAFSVLLNLLQKL